MNDEILKIYKNNEISSVLNQIDLQVASYLTKDEKDSIKLITIWKCLKGFNKKKSKFKTYLIRSYKYNLWRESKLLLKNKISPKVEATYIDNTDKEVETKELIDLLSKEDRTLVYQRFYENYTLKEMSEFYGVCHQLIDYRIKRALKRLKTEYNNMDRTLSDAE